MNFHTDVKDTIDPKMFDKRVTRAAHTVAKAAQKDINGFVPRATGRLRESVQLDGRKVRWPGPYAGVLLYGHLMVDPKTNKGGYPFPNYGPKEFRSRHGVKKVDSGRMLVYQIGVRNWIIEATTVFGDRWLKMARKELLKDH